MILIQVQYVRVYIHCNERKQDSERGWLLVILAEETVQVMDLRIVLVTDGEIKIGKFGGATRCFSVTPDKMAVDDMQGPQQHAKGRNHILHTSRDERQNQEIVLHPTKQNAQRMTQVESMPWGDRRHEVVRLVLG
jgi:hypothetical protein